MGGWGVGGLGGDRDDISTVWGLFDLFIDFTTSTHVDVSKVKRWKAENKRKRKTTKKRKEIIEIYVQLVIFYIYLWRRLGFYCWERKLPFVLFQLLLINSMCLR